MMNSGRKKCVLDIEVTDYLPWRGQIIVVGIMDIQTGETRVFHECREESLLLQFIRFFDKCGFEEVIGYNVGFDLRYLFVKCLRYQLRAQSLLSAQQTDLMLIMKGTSEPLNYNRCGKFGHWTNSLMGEVRSLQHTSISELYREGRIRDIIEQNRRDLELTYRLWRRISFVTGGHCEKMEEG
jgi:hypothetical protein